MAEWKCELMISGEFWGLFLPFFVKNEEKRCFFVVLEEIECSFRG